MKRGSTIVVIRFGFGDAAKAGFGGGLGGVEPGKGFVWSGRTKKGAWIRFGVWGADMDDKSSNNREFKNLVELIEEEASAGRLNGAEALLFTDNMVSEQCYYKGTSSDPELFDYILRLRILELEISLRLHIIWSAGTRQIKVGMDGLSRGNTTEGIMRGLALDNFIVLANTAFERHAPLLEWVRGWAGRPSLKPLSPEEWYVEGHGIVGGEKDQNNVWIPIHKVGLHLWAPPPAAADVALQELGKARHKDVESTHIFVCPDTMMPRWRHYVYKVSDFVTRIPAGSNFWPKSMHEPLIVALVLPFTRHRPWELRGTPRLLGLGRRLSRLWSSSPEAGGRILRQLLLLPKKVDAVSELLARKMLQGGSGE